MRWKIYKGEIKNMIWVLIIILTIGCILYAICKKKKLIKVDEDKKKALKIIVIANIVLVVIMSISLSLRNWFNWWGMLIIIALNVVVLIFNQKLSKNKVVIIITIVIYFVLMFIIPVYKYEDHEHIFNEGGEEIKEYNSYYNCYSVNLYKQYIN